MLYVCFFYEENDSIIHNNLRKKGVNMNEYEDRLKKLGKYIKETMDPINIAVSKFNNSLKPITDFVERLNIKLKPFFEIIDREYNVDKDKYDIAIQQLCNNGFYLPFLSTPRLYIEINSYSNEP